MNIALSVTVIENYACFHLKDFTKIVGLILAGASVKLSMPVQCMNICACVYVTLVSSELCVK